MEKAWAAIHRRPDHVGPVQSYYDQCFGALAATQEPLPPGVVIPDTFVFSHAGWKWYAFSTSQRKVIVKPAVQCTTQRVIDHCCEGRLPGGGRQQIVGDDDPMSGCGANIVAVWSSDRRDARGLLSSVEYLTADGLAKFFVTGERKKLGVLQQFIYPRLLNMEDSVNQELLLHWNPVESVVVERRSSRYNFDTCSVASGSLLHPTQRALVHPAISVMGKLTSLTNPFSSNEIKTIGEGLAGVDVFAHHAASLCDHVATSLESMRSLSGTKEGRGVSSLTLSCKFSRDGGFLFLLGITNLRFPGDHENHELTFDIIPPRTGMNALSSYIPPNRAAVQTSRGEFDIQQTPHSSMQRDGSEHSLKSSTNRSHNQQQRDSLGSYNDSLDDGEGNDESYVDEGDDGEQIPMKGVLDAFPCPNCGVSHERQDFVPVPYKNLVKAMEVQGKVTKGNLSKLIPPAAPKVNMSTRKHGDAPPKRPKSARVAASFDKVRLIDDQAACFKTKSYSWSEAPPALRKLNITIQELTSRPVWLSRTVSLCHGCGVKYGTAGDASSPSPQRFERPHKSMSTHASKVKANADRLDATGIADRMVLTDLQKYHRTLRRTERDKKEMRDVIEEVRAGSPRGRTDEQDLKIIAGALGRLCIADNSPVTAGSTPDAPLSIMLMNELYHVMDSICGKPLDDGEGDIPVVLAEIAGSGAAGSGGASLLNTPFPKPTVVMDVRGMDEMSVRAEREKHAGVNVGRQISHGTLIVNSEANTVSRLKESERRLLIDVVGEDRDRPLEEGNGGDLGGGGDEDIPY